MYYNAKLFDLRMAKGLSRRDAAKQIGIPTLALTLYERGTFKPIKRHLAKLEAFYGEHISMEGEDSYPVPLHEPKKRGNLKQLKIARRGNGILAIAMLVVSIVGGTLFTVSIKSSNDLFGETYKSLAIKAKTDGSIGRDVVTSTGYHALIDQETTDGDGQCMLVFYDTDSILYFNKNTFTIDNFDDALKGFKCSYTFGSNLGTNSYYCDFFYTTYLDNESATCRFLYHGEPVTGVSNLSVITDVGNLIDEAFMVEKVNDLLPNALFAMDDFISEQLGRKVSFYRDFLPAREQGRQRHFALQSVGIVSLFVGIPLFYVFLTVFLFAATKRYREQAKPHAEPLRKEGEETLRTDIHMPIGISHRALTIACILAIAVTFFLRSLGLFAKLGLGPSFLANSTLNTVASTISIGALFLIHIVALVGSKNPRNIRVLCILDAELFLLLASFETALFLVLRAWHYNFESLIGNFIPFNFGGLFFCLTLAAFFLFSVPRFLAKSKRRKNARILWHALAVFPLALLFVFQRIGASYSIDYGVKANIYVKIWFPTGYLLLFSALALYLVLAFFYRVWCERHYGKSFAQIYFYGDRYALIEAAIAATCMVVAAIIDVSLAGNQYAYYLGIGSNYWFFVLAAIVPLIRLEPLYQESVSLIA